MEAGGKDVFWGTYHHSIDPKGRTSLPAKFREVLASRSEDQFVLMRAPQKTPMLWCFSPGDFARTVEQIIQSPPPGADPGLLRRAFLGASQPCPLDRMGRVLIPPDLRRHAGIENGGEVVWMGLKDRVELLSPAVWKAREEADSARIQSEEFEQVLAQLGL